MIPFLGATHFTLRVGILQCNCCVAWLAHEPGRLALRPGASCSVQVTQHESLIKEFRVALEDKAATLDGALRRGDALSSQLQVCVCLWMRGWCGLCVSGVLLCLCMFMCVCVFVYVCLCVCLRACARICAQFCLRKRVR